jgi:hypothetical protein
LPNFGDFGRGVSSIKKKEALLDMYEKLITLSSIIGKTYEKLFICFKIMKESLGNGSNLVN